MSEFEGEAYLEQVTGPERRKFSLDPGVVCQIGRDEQSMIVLADNQVSRRHAMVQRAPAGEFYLTDLGSRNGTWLNQRRVTAPVALHDSDRINIGGQEFSFHGPARKAQPQPAKHGETVVEFVQRLITVLVVDIRDFTGLSRRLPEARLSELISTFMRESGVVLTGENAWGQKYIGDAVMAIWLHSTDALKIEEMTPVFRSLERIVAIASRLQVTLGLDAPIRVGAGVNTGTACIGNMGSDASSDYTALSDAVNLAFRLEAATRQIDEDVAVGSKIYEFLAERAGAGELFQKHELMLKGYREPKPVYGIGQSFLPGLLEHMERSLPGNGSAGTGGAAGIEVRA
jgi:adenylate cyclase